MGRQYTVQAGDCMSSIAFSNGFFWQTLWDHPQNSELKTLRKDPNILMPGDSVFIPDLDLSPVSKASGARHQFELKGVPAKLKLCLTRNNKPRAGLKFKLVIDGIASVGTIGSDGIIEHPIPPGAREGKLVLYDGPMIETKNLVLGGVDPISAATGIQDRLRNLGYNPGPASATLSEAAVDALKQFQTDQGLEATGRADAGTLDRLRQAHGC